MSWTKGALGACSRRDWLKRAGAATGVALLYPLAGCEDCQPLSPQPPIELGPIGGEQLPDDYAVGVFDVDASAGYLWAMAPGPSSATLEIHGLGEIGTFDLGTSGTGAMRISKLLPRTEYRYRVVFEGGLASPWGRFVTAPLATSDVDIRFGVSADIGPRPEYHGAFAAVPWGLDFFVNLGDWPYADKAPAAFSLAEYRQKHRDLRNVPLIKEFLTKTSFVSIYDDHDVADNWDGAFRINAPERVAAGLEAWDEYFPGRSGIRYRRWQWGRHVELFMLDTRLYRSANALADGPDKTMLGAEQLAWLAEGLKASTATFRIVLSSVPLDFTGSVDSWESFASERTELMAQIQSAGTALVISADRHYFAKHLHANAVREYMVGPLAAGVNNPSAELPAQVVATAQTRNFLEVSVVGQSEPSMRLDVRDEDGCIVFSDTIEP